MAICFDMQISFLQEDYDYEAFLYAIQSRIQPYKNIGFHRLHANFISSHGGDKSQLCISPKGVSMGSSLDVDVTEYHQLDDDACLALSLHMYEFIKELGSYNMACVGWELPYLSQFLDYDEAGVLQSIAAIEGLVVSNKLFQQCVEPISDEWQVFDDTHYWIPCESAIGNIIGNDADDNE